jgi:carbamoyl-phosphate synthase large subunit
MPAARCEIELTMPVSNSPFNILISSGGRRLELLDCFRSALEEIGQPGYVCVTDSSPLAPALHLADRGWQVPRCTESSFISELLELALREEIRVIIPTIDTELPVYASCREMFARRGIAVCVSDAAAVDICGDKTITHPWLLEHGFPTVVQARPEEVLAATADWLFPVLAKPARGSSSKGIRFINSMEELKAVSARDADLIIQEIAPGTEYTINTFVDVYGKCVCAVPHARLEVRGGEVSKAVTRKDRELMNLARDISEALPGAYGPLNVQCFKSAEGRIAVIEINARFGGGYPLAHEAGAPFARWIVEEVLEYPALASCDDWQDDLAMLRYDRSLFRHASDLRRNTDVKKTVSSV